MRKSFFIGIAIFGLVLFGYSVKAQTISKSQAAKSAAFARVELSRVRLAPCTQTVKKCATTIIAASDMPLNDVPLTSFKVFYFPGNKVVAIVDYDINEDDSVAGHRYRVEFVKSAGKLEFVGLGVQYRCARGRKGWSKELCS